MRKNAKKLQFENIEIKTKILLNRGILATKYRRLYYFDNNIYEIKNKTLRIEREENKIENATNNKIDNYISSE